MKAGTKIHGSVTWAGLVIEVWHNRDNNWFAELQSDDPHNTVRSGPWSNQTEAEQKLCDVLNTLFKLTCKDINHEPMA